jgi:hypothetical protein
METIGQAPVVKYFNLKSDIELKLQFNCQLPKRICKTSHKEPISQIQNVKNSIKTQLFFNNKTYKIYTKDLKIKIKRGLYNKQRRNLYNNYKL